VNFRPKGGHQILNRTEETVTFLAISSHGRLPNFGSTRKPSTRAYSRNVPGLST